MEVGISSCRAPLLLTGGGNNAILVKAKGIINGVDPRPMRHSHHIDIKTEEPDSSLAFEEETATAAVSVPTKQHLLNLNVTRCPICQKFVLDLPQHISLTHHQPRPASAMVLPTAAAAAAINLVKKEDNSNGAPINLSVRNNNNDSINNNHSPPLRGASPSPKSSPAAALALAALAGAAANSPGVALIGSRVPSDDISSSGESSVGSGSRSPSSASMTPVQIATAAAAQLTAAAASAADDTPRKRRKQTHVPDANKDERYWTRRLKNNEAAKRSRDMRIKRERVVFEENQRLENMNKELRLEMDKFITENKELRLKMDIVMEDNARLKNLLVSYQTADQERRRSMEQSEEARPGKPVLLLKEDV